MPEVESGASLIHRLEIPGYGGDEVEFFEQTITLLKPDFIGEWGTNRGSSARIMYELTQLHGIRTEIHTVDLPRELELLDHDHSGIAQGQFIRELPVVQHSGDGVTEILSAWRKSGTGRPLFFLDGDHMKENVFREIVWINRAAPRASLLLHDTTDGPGQAARDFTERFPDAYNLTELHSQAGMMRLWPR